MKQLTIKLDDERDNKTINEIEYKRENKIIITE